MRLMDITYLNNRSRWILYKLQKDLNITKETTKTEKVFLRMSPKDKAKLQSNAKKEGKTMSAYIRSKVLL